MAIKNEVQLITYPDSMGGDIKSLNKSLATYFPNVFKGGIHILPPFPSSGDRGFAPITYLEIEEKFGSWSDIKDLGEKYEIMVDVMVNHISRKSIYFQDFLKNGKKSKYADFFITLDKIWEDGVPTKEDLDKIFLRRKSPFSTYSLDSGEDVTVWTTFGKTDPSEQIDLDIHAPAAREMLKQVFINFRENNIKQVRLDAVGYVIKERGTSCFFVEPQIYEFLDEFKKMSDGLGIDLLPEVHSDKSIQYELSNRGYWIYDFVLPFTVLSTIISGNSKSLTDYLYDRPMSQFTMLDCHDGIPVLPDLEGMLNIEEAKKVTNLCAERGATMSRIIKNDPNDKATFDVHQINGTFYSMLGEDDDAYIASRAIQFFVPGIPQVYYVGLLAGKNDYSSDEIMLDGRVINRHNYTFEEIEEASKLDVVKRLVRLIHFRNEFIAFNGDFRVEDCSNSEVKLIWSKEKSYCKLHIDLNHYSTTIEYSENGSDVKKFFA